MGTHEYKWHVSIEYFSANHIRQLEMLTLAVLQPANLDE
jgi:hypothetical protein